MALGADDEPPRGAASLAVPPARPRLGVAQVAEEAAEAAVQGAEAGPLGGAAVTDGVVREGVVRRRSGKLLSARTRALTARMPAPMATASFK
ncbi:hypothetical protein OV079_47545 [Nannocystis pusilla]|uniref:Uncharacterized protein n=1 Tax=Nannocystis pusilla TaxID=889268 RepID=A0A9X3F0N7_9BACT|nr:hypothetical protein [Nannocystis pusilla]MCY1013065.1 hypothetical protein [Nannocystis pusilla]